MDKMKMQTKNLIQENIETIKNLFPEVVTEGKDPEGRLREVIDFDRLKEILGDDVSISPEHYEFTWVGKRNARRLAATPINMTLRPCKEESKDWDSTENLYIEGDNLDVLKLLQESYLGKVKMIYIDPPYNTGKDFVYKDNFHQSQEDWKEQTTIVDEENNRLAVNPDSSGRFHSDWCTMMYPRLKLAKNLLRDDGVIFISIDDHELGSLKEISDEIFGENNFEGHIHWRRRHNQPNDKTKMIGIVTEHVLVYSKDSIFFKEKGVGKLDITGKFTNPDNDKLGPWASKPWKVGSDQSGSSYTIITPTGKKLEEEWMGDEDTFKKLFTSNRIIFPKNGDGMPRKKYYQFERILEGQCATNWWPHEIFGHNQGANDCLFKLFGQKNIFSNPKPIELLRGFIQLSNAKEEEIILDFFSGSATTAHAVMQLNAEDGCNRKFIMVQVPEKCDEKSEAFKEGYFNICEIGKERIRRAGEKIKKEFEQGNTQLELGAEPQKVPDIGFRVLKLDSSNMNDVYYGAAELEQKDLFDSESNIKYDRTELDVLFGIMLDWGLPLSLPYKKEMIGNTVIHNVEDGALIACFTDNISEEVIIAIAKRQATKVVFKDSCFSSSVDRINVEQLFKHYDPTFASNTDKIRVV